MLLGMSTKCYCELNFTINSIFELTVLVPTILIFWTFWKNQNWQFSDSGMFKELWAGGSLLKNLKNHIQHWLELAIRGQSYYATTTWANTCQHSNFMLILDQLQVRYIFVKFTELFLMFFLLTWYWQGYLNFEFYEVRELAITWEILAIGTYIGEIYFGNMLEPTFKTWSSQTFFSLKYGEICRPLFFLVQKSIRCLR